MRALHFRRLSIINYYSDSPQIELKISQTEYLRVLDSKCTGIFDVRNSFRVAFDSIKEGVDERMDVEYFIPEQGNDPRGLQSGEPHLIRS